MTFSYSNSTFTDKQLERQLTSHETFPRTNFACDSQFAFTVDRVLLCRISGSRNNKGHVPDDDFLQTPLKSGRFESAEEGRKAVVGGVGFVDAIRSSRWIMKGPGYVAGNELPAKKLFSVIFHVRTLIFSQKRPRRSAAMGHERRWK